MTRIKSWWRRRVHRWTSLAPIPADVRRSAGRAARSNLLELLEETPPLDLERGEADAVEKLLNEIMNGSAGGEA